MGDRPVPGPQSLEPLPRRNPKVAARVIDGEALIVTPHDNMLHTLNAVATRIWELLPERRSLDELLASLLEEFEVDRATAEGDVRELLAELAEKRIVE